MLSRIEIKIMDFIFEKCQGKKTVLISPTDVLGFLEPKFEITKKELDNYIKNLSLDGYIESLKSDNKGQTTYVVKLKTRGEGFLRERAEIKSKRLRSIGWKVALTVGGAILAFVLSIVLPIIFR